MATTSAGAAAPSSGLLGAEWPLTGWTGELRILEALLARPDARGLVLAGAAGVGQTRLAQECLARAERAGRPTARTVATRAAAELPFGAVAPLLPSAGPEGVTGGDRAQLLRRFAAALGERPPGGRLVLLVDDAHLLDNASATLIYQLAASGAALLLVTIRAREPAPEPITGLWKDGLLDRLELDGIDGEVTEKLLGVALGGPVDRAAVARLAARCQGNALFLRELVLGAVSAGSLVRDGGVWRLVGPLAPSQRLVELVETRLAGLGEADRAPRRGRRPGRGGRGSRGPTGRLARAAHEAGAGFDAAVLSAQLASLSGRGTQAEAELVALATEATDEDERGLLAVSRIDNFRYMGRLEQALSVADEAALVTEGVWRWSGPAWSRPSPSAGPADWGRRWRPPTGATWLTWLWPDRPFRGHRAPISSPRLTLWSTPAGSKRPRPWLPANTSGRWRSARSTPRPTPLGSWPGTS